jgi:hypothetical protein
MILKALALPPMVERPTETKPSEDTPLVQVLLLGLAAGWMSVKPAPWRAAVAAARRVSFERVRI